VCDQETSHARML